MFSLACKLTKNDVEFLPIETRKQRGFFDHQNYTEKSIWKQRGFFDHRNYVEKSRWKQRGLVDQQNYIKKVRGNDVEI